MQRDLTILVLFVLLLVNTVEAKNSSPLEKKNTSSTSEIIQGIKSRSEKVPIDIKLTPLQEAAAFNPDTTVLIKLIKDGADVNFRPNQGWTALMYAVMDNPNPEAVYTLINASADVNALDDSGCTALSHAAMSNQHPEVINALVKAGANVNVKDREGQTPLIVAAIYSGTPEVVSAIIKAGADLNACDNDGRNFLICAAHSNNMRIVSLILKTGTDVNFRSKKDGFTALMAASRNPDPNPEIILALLAAGAKANLKDSSGKSALDYARENKKLLRTEAFKKLEVATNSETKP
ncbi:MAG: ankyrin repeat domain-containing protein [Candidatus Riflebacteria bacterium]|nr:ankyrin repeat domain-containing protein [Candidatus Riflebacteria bacterium]